MKLTIEQKEAYREVYKLAEQARDLAAWKWMYENQIFGIKIPENDTMWYASIMGSEGEHYCYCFYRGEAGLAGYFEMTDLALFEADVTSTAELLFLQNCLQVSFDNRDQMTPEQRALLKELGLTYRGANKWVSLTDFTPMLWPWLVDAEELPVLKRLLLLTIEVAKRQAQEPDFIGYLQSEDEEIKIFDASAQTLTWTTEKLDLDIDLGPIYAPVVNPTAWEQLSDKTVMQHFSLCIGQVPGGFPTQEHDKQRPFFPWIFLIVDLASEAITGVITTRPEDYPAFEKDLIAVLAQLDHLPEVVQTTDEAMVDLLSPYLKLVDIKVEESEAAVKIMDEISSFFPGTGNPDMSEE